LPQQRFGNRSLADGFGFSLLVFTHSVLIRVRPGGGGGAECPVQYKTLFWGKICLSFL
jgi:hypothetical protein